MICYKAFIYSVLCLSLVFFSASSALSKPSKETKELLSVVEKSCKSSCIKKKGDQVFCSSYCQCIRGRVEAKAEKSDVYKALNKPESNKALISQCSGQTAIKFFSSSCRSKCKGAPKCSSYCSCLENKIKFKQRFSDIGDFFIQIGENKKPALKRLKRFEASCMK